MQRDEQVDRPERQQVDDGDRDRRPGGGLASAADEPVPACSTTSRPAGALYVRATPTRATSATSRRRTPGPPNPASAPMPGPIDPPSSIPVTIPLAAAMLGAVRSRSPGHRRRPDRPAREALHEPRQHEHDRLMRPCGACRTRHQDRRRERDPPRAEARTRGDAPDRHHGHRHLGRPRRPRPAPTVPRPNRSASSGAAAAARPGRRTHRRTRLDRHRDPP